MKFFPVYDGGILGSHAKTINQDKLDSPSFFFQIKSGLNVIQLATRYRRLGIAGKLLRFITSTAESAWKVIKKGIGREHSGIHGPSSSGGGYGLDEAWIHRRASWFSKVVIQHQRYERITQARRKHYLKLETALGSLPLARPLFDSLPDGVVPLVFPLYVERPDLLFSPLKNAGVPIWRFGEYLDDAITRDVCRNSIDLSAHVFQFPCHQDLTEEELNWMIATITQTFAAQTSAAKK
jgi:hypothetical protein